MEPALGTLHASVQSLDFILGPRGLTKERVNLTGLCFGKMNGENVEALVEPFRRPLIKI